MRRVLILGIDTFAAKNVEQLRVMNGRGYAFDVVTEDSLGTSERRFAGLESCNRLVVLRGSRLERLRSVRQLIHAGGYHHVELYAASIYAWLYVRWIRASRTPLLVVERGDIRLLQEYDFLTRNSLLSAYGCASVVLYKETYMEEPLRALRRGAIAFLPNAVSENPGARVRAGQGDFLWVNRITPERRAHWVVEAFATAPLDGRRLTVVGVLDAGRIRQEAREAQALLSNKSGGNVLLFGYQDPQPHYAQATFFCLAAEVVFGNNALLEAMAAGLVPIVTRAPGVELIVKDGVNGIVTDFSEQAYADGLRRAAALPDAEVARLSRAALETVRTQYSVGNWARELTGVYESLRKPAAT